MFAILIVSLCAGLVGGNPLSDGMLRGMSGPLSVHRQDIREMAEFATLTMNSKSDKQYTRIIEIVSANTTVVTGFLYFITMKLTDESQVQQCFVAVFDQSWTNTRQLLHFTCRPIPEDPENCPGCISGPLDVNRMDVRAMAKYAVAAINRLSSGRESSLVTVLSAKKRVVVGVNYYLTLRITHDLVTEDCDVVVFAQKGSGNQSLTSRSCHVVQSEGPEALDMNSGHTIQDIARQAVQTLNQLRTGSESSLVSVNLASVKVKTDDAGIDFNLTLTITDGTHFELCNVTIFHKLRSNTRHLTKHSCQPTHKQISASVVEPVDVEFVGSVQPAALDRTVRESAMYAAEEINKMTKKSLNRMVVIRMFNITKQVVAGLLYRMDLIMGTSVCVNNVDNQGLSITDCPLQVHGTIHKCHVEVLFQAWKEPKYHLEQFHCV